MSTRLRLLAAMLASAFVGTLYVTWTLATLNQFYHYYARHETYCLQDWRYVLNGCTQFRPMLAWLELAIATAVLAVFAAALIRWAQYPLRAMARSVDDFGPTNLGQRLAAGNRGEATRELSAAINRMLARVADGYEAQRRFAASASHELRTPLATQRALVEVSLIEPLTPQQQELLGRQLLATNERNVTLVDGLLTLAEAEQGLVLREQLDVEPLVDAVIESLRPLAQRRGVTLVPATASAHVIGERALLERLVANLVQNAIKYNVEGGRVEVFLTDAPPTLTVRNTGEPVPADEVPGLFEPFRRLAGDRLAGTDGAGLGLTIVRTIVAAHDGRVSARANDDGGLIVSVTLPAVG